MARQSRHEERRGNTLRSCWRAGARLMQSGMPEQSKRRGEFRADEES